MECDTSQLRRDGFNPAGPVPFLGQLRKSRDVRVGGGSRLPCAPPDSPIGFPTFGQPNYPAVDPFMSEMDEVSYWIHTKRAPCLFNYDNPIKKRIKAHSSKEPRSVTEDTHSPKRKKKRKLSLLDDDSVSTERQQNVYFESQKQTRHVENVSKSDTLGSDVDFNIKKISVREKRKKAKIQKNTRTTIHKKNKVVTSTPKANVNLRRSLRHNKGVNHFNNSFEIYHSSVKNGGHTANNINTGKPTDKLNQPELLAGGDQTVDNKRNSNVRNKTKTPAQNGQFDDMSDVSGFTANYIRSTKVQSNKTPRKLRCKSNRNLVLESQQQNQNESNMVVTVNKSVNTGVPNNVLNCSTDSSQNLINLVTNKSNDKPAKVDKSTSLLKFMETKTKEKDGRSHGRKNKANLNISFQSQSSSTSRYPKRNKTATTSKMAVVKSADKRKNDKNCIESNNSDKKENPGDKLVSKTRSGRNIGLSMCQRENSVLVVSNSTDPVSSMVSLNVASPNLAQGNKKKRTPTRQPRSKKPMDKVQSPKRDSLRDRSGFAACFSESDDDSAPLVQRKYFCA